MTISPAGAELTTAGADEEVTCRSRMAMLFWLAELWQLIQDAPLPRWITPLLIVLGLASSLTETVGITLVLLFFYLAMGQAELAFSTGGLLGNGLQYAITWLHGSTETAIVVLLLHRPAVRHKPDIHQPPPAVALQ